MNYINTSTVHNDAQNPIMSYCDSMAYGTVFIPKEAKRHYIIRQQEAEK